MCSASVRKDSSFIDAIKDILNTVGAFALQLVVSFSDERIKDTVQYMMSTGIFILTLVLLTSAISALQTC